ncbi:MAG: adenylyl-sulfate kinase [Burkholderiales bacterium]|nr:adenylyl-sulfate kinase [Burkholderiales bacterium]
MNTLAPAPQQPPPRSAAEPREILRFLACGSVDDGKSTLLGRLLHDAGLVADDHWDSVLQESARLDKTGGLPDYSLLLDGLLSEREQSITIDVAWRYFEAGHRKYIVADTPGHEQYTRNMATGASHCDAALLVVDARRGVQEQTRRHLSICQVMGISHVAVAINKMDMVNWDKLAFDKAKNAIEHFCRGAGYPLPVCIPVSALHGDNVFRRSDRASWHLGQTVFGFIEGVDIPAPDRDAPVRIFVQGVIRPDQSFRGIQGHVVSGTVRVGDSLRILPSGETAFVERIAGFDVDIDSVSAGLATTIVLDRNVDVARGDVLVSHDRCPMVVTDQVEASVIWMDEAPLLAGRRYEFRLGSATVPANVKRLMHRLNLQDPHEEEAVQLDRNDIGRCEISLERPIACDRHVDQPESGVFVLVDRISNATCGAGMITAVETRKVSWQDLEVDKLARSRLMGQSPKVAWFTGLSGAGKSTLANAVEKALYSRGLHSYLLDGDNIRHGLSRDLGFGDADRSENIRRVGEVARLMVDAGLVVLVAFISPFKRDRQMVRDMFTPGEFIEVFVNTPIEVCEKRDTKGLYRLAREGRIPGFTGITSPYEPPEKAEVVLDAGLESVDACVAQVMRALGVEAR